MDKDKTQKNKTDDKNDKKMKIKGEALSNVIIENLDLGTGQRKEKIAHVAFILIVLVLVAIILKNLGGIFKPLIVSIFFVFIMQPAVRIFNKYLKIPRGLGFLFVFVILVLVFYFSGILIQANLSGLSEKLPNYEMKINEFLKNINTKYDLYPGSSLSIKEILKLIPKSAYSDLFSATANIFYEIVTFLVFVLIISVFFLMEAKNIDLRILKAFGKQKSEKIRRVYKNITSNINKYLVTKALINLLTSITAGILMLIFGIDFFVLWIFIMFIMLWIPYIGNIISLVPPILLGFLQYGSSIHPILFTILIITSSLIWGNVVEPKFLGKRLNISPLLVILAMTFFGWLWGIVGIILAVPIVVAIKIVAENFNATKPISILMSEAIDEQDAEKLKNQYVKET